MLPCRRFIPLLIAALPASSLWGAIGATYMGPDIGSYNLAANWSCNSIPINAGVNTYDVFIDGNPGRNCTVNILGSAIVNTLSIAAGDSLALTNSLYLTIGAGSLANDGTLRITSEGNYTDLYFATSGSLTGGGQLLMSGSPYNRIYGVGGSTLSNFNTISGAGQVGINYVALTNYGRIIATLPQGLSVDPTDAGTSFTNNGTLMADGGPLSLLAGTYTGGVLDARSNSTVSIASGAHVRNAVFRSDGSGASVAFAGGTVSDILNTGRISLPNNSWGYLRYSVVNQGVIALLAGANYTDLICSANVALAGGGTVTLSNSSVNRIYSSGAVFTFTTDNFITGAGQLGVNNTAFLNTGTIVASSPAGLTIDPVDRPDGFVNKGTLRANGGSLLLYAGTFTNAGATIEALSGSTVTLSSATAVGGLLRTDDHAASRFILTNSGLVDVTFNGHAAIPNGATAYFYGAITNQGTLELDSQGNGADFHIGNVDVSLAGSGSLVLSSNSTTAALSRIIGSGSRFVSAQPILGAGQVGANSIRITNNSLIAATAQPGITIDPHDAADGFINNGILRADGAPLTLYGGTFTNNGTIDARNSANVAVSSAHIAGGTLTSDASARILLYSSGISDLAIKGTVAVPNSYTGYLYGNITVDRTLRVDAASNTTDLHIQNMDVALAGAGSLVLTSLATTYAHGRVIGSGARLTSAIPILGVGNLGANSMRFTNNSLVAATALPGLTIDPADAGDGFLNNGTLRADGGPLTLLNGTFTNHPATGRVEALNASDVHISGCTITNGTLTTDASSRFLIYNSTLRNVALSGNTTIVNGYTLYAAGTLTNTGILALDCQGNGVDFNISNLDATLAGAGSLVLASTSTVSAPGRIVGSFARLTNNSSILGTGSVGANSIKFTNHGLIAATAFPGMTIDPNDAADGFISDGILRADGAPLSFAYGIYTIPGAIQALRNGSFTFSTGSYNVTGPITLTNGSATFNGESQAIATIAGNGTVTLPVGRTLTSDGISAKNLILQGVLTIRPNGGNSGVSRFDALTLAGAADAWTGKLNLTNNAFILQTAGGDAKTAAAALLQNQINTGRHGGDWLGNGITSSLMAANATTPSPSLLLLLVDNADLHYATYRGQPLDDNALIVSVVPLGDANVDGSVNAFDLNILAAHWQQQDGANWVAGDFTGDGKVDAFDLNVLAASWQVSVNPTLQLAPLDSLPGAVPEPASAALLALGAGALLIRRRRRPPA